MQWAVAERGRVGVADLTGPTRERCPILRPVPGTDEGAHVSSEQALQPPVRPGPALRISLPMPYRSASLMRFLANEAGSAGLL